MARTVVYKEKLGAEGGDARVDGLREKIVKYVPAELLAFWVPYAAADQKPSDVKLALIAMVALAPLVAFSFAQTVEPERRPILTFYPLTSLAALAWAGGTSSVAADLLNMSTDRGRLWLGIATIGIPIIDTALASMWKAIREWWNARHQP